MPPHNKYKLINSLRRKMTIQMKELEESLANAQSKLASVEKTKARIASELEDVNLDLEKVLYI